MENEELLHALALQRAKGIGDVCAKKLIAVCGSAKQVFCEKEKTLQKIPGLKKRPFSQLFDPSNLKAAEEEARWIEAQKIRPVYFLEANYPQSLKNAVDGPMLMFQDGEVSFQNTKCISIVGTRQMTPYGRDFCERLISDLKSYRPIIVSGFAYGVDICAHRAALKNQLKTVGVFAHGFGMTYPKSHKPYQAEILKKGGFLTEFWHEEKPLKENFVRRNRIVAGISEATIVVESPLRGGALITAAFANSYSKEVFALPGKVTDRCSQGCNALIRDHKAAVITDAEDLVRMLGWTSQQRDSNPQQLPLFLDLNGDQQKVVDFLSARKSALLDLISLDCDLPIGKTASLLFELELKGLVRPLPGKMFEFLSS